MEEKVKKIIDFYNGLIEYDKLIFIDLIRDLLGYNKYENPLTKSLHYKYFENKYKNKILISYYNLSVKKHGKKKVDKGIKLLYDTLSKKNFGGRLGDNNTILPIATGKVKNYSGRLKALVEDKILTQSQIQASRRIILEYFQDNKLILIGEKSEDDFNIFETLNIAERYPEKDPFYRLIKELIEDFKDKFGDEEYEKGKDETKLIDNRLDVCLFKKENFEKIYMRISNSKITYSCEDKIIYYLGEPIHKLEEGNKNTIFFDKMYSFPVGTNINFKEFYNLYNIDDYYQDIDNKGANESVKGLILKANKLIKEKTGEKSLLLFSQQKEHNNRYIIRNF